MKALEILKWSQDNIPNSHLDRLCGENWDNFISEAIKEIEELNNRSCESCKCWDSVKNSKLKTISYCRFLNTGTKNSFYCNEYEKKDSE